MKTQTIRFLILALLLCAAALPSAAAPPAGKISGIVADPAGTPQMGATVVITSEDFLGFTPAQFLTNDRGHFTTVNLFPGFYSVRVTLAGFLPAIEPHIRVTDDHTTLLQIALGSVFSSFENLRRQTNQHVASDEWTWVLRTSSATRPVLRWDDGDILLDAESNSFEARQRQNPRGRVELTSGAHHPGSISNLADSPSTSVVYDQSISGEGNLLLAGQFGYESASATSSFAAEWLPSGESKAGPQTSLVVRESQLGPQGPTFRGLRLEHENQTALSDTISLRYGGEYILAGYGGVFAALRPRGEIAVQVAPGWQASFILATRPWEETGPSISALESALDSLDTFPTLLVRNGRPVLEDDFHEEVALQHTIGQNGSLEAAVFHDKSNHTAVFGRGAVSNPDFVQDFFSDAFAYDGGVMSSWGSRLAFREKFSDNLDATLVYAWAAGFMPEGPVTTGELREALLTRYRHSLAARISSRFPRLGTQLTASYKWINGPIVSHQDAYGENIYHLDPNLNLAVRQRLPHFMPCHVEAMAEFGNLLEQGYIPIETHDGQFILVPAYRSFRGGLSFQF